MQRTHRSARIGGMTLIELLVVIAIIALMLVLASRGIKAGVYAVRDGRETMFMEKAMQRLWLAHTGPGQKPPRVYTDGATYRLDPDSLLSVLEIRPKDWSDPYRKHTLEDIPSLQGFNFLYNDDFPEDGRRRIYLDFASTLPDGSYVINAGFPGDPIVEANRFCQDNGLKLRFPERTQFAVISAGADGELQFDPELDRVYLMVDGKQPYELKP